MAEREGAAFGSGMIRTPGLLRLLTDRAHPLAHDTEVELALLDADGVIVAVNNAWLAFCAQNGGDFDRSGVGMSYLDMCDAAGDVGSSEVAAGIRTALAGELPAPVVVTIRCDAPGVPRKFDVLMSSRLDDQGNCVGATVTLSRREDHSRQTAHTDSGSAQPADIATSVGADHPAELPTMIEERERIATHLNNVVMSGLFSIGMGLQGMLGGLPRPEDKTRLARYVEALDVIVREIRTTVFELAPAEPDRAGLKLRLMELVDESGSHSLGTGVEFSGPLDSDVSDEVADIVVQVVRAALSDVVRRSGVSTVHVSVALTDALITVKVFDDGTADSGATLGAGLRQVRRFAEQSGGDLQVTKGAAGGTLLRWTALLEKDRRHGASFARRHERPSAGPLEGES